MPGTQWGDFADAPLDTNSIAFVLDRDVCYNGFFYSLLLPLCQAGNWYGETEHDRSLRRRPVEVAE